MTKIFVPFSVDEFERKTAADIDRLLLAIVLRLNTTKLYRNQTDSNSPTRPLFVAYPNLRDRIIFYNEEQQNGTLDLICTRKLTIGATLNDLGDTAVCDRLRSDAWNLYDVSASNSTQVGHVRFVRPPRRVVFLRDRFDRVDELTAALRAAAAHHRFELEIRTAGSLVTARDQVKTFAGAGVLLMARGVHKLGPLWMPRHSSIVEVFPPGYTDFKVRSVAKACNLWYHELHGRITQERREEYLDKCVNDAGIIGPEQCTVMNKYNIEIDVDETMRMVMLAYKKLGYDVAT